MGLPVDAETLTGLANALLRLIRTLAVVVPELPSTKRRSPVDSAGGTVVVVVDHVAQTAPGVHRKTGSVVARRLIVGGCGMARRRVGD